MLGKQLANIVLKGGIVKLPIDKLCVVGIGDTHFDRCNLGKIYGVNTIKLGSELNPADFSSGSNNHNGIFKNFAGNDSLINLFPELKNIILIDLYHPLDIQWLNQHKYRIWISSQYPNIHNLMLAVNSNLVDIKRELPKISFNLDFKN